METESILETALDTERRWYLLWAPTGFGGTTNRVKDVERVLRKFDAEAVAWYPMQPELIEGKTLMKAVYAGYMFTYCIWNPSMEDSLIERLPVYVEFLKDDETLTPFFVPTDEIEAVKKAVTEMASQPQEAIEVKGFRVGDDVRILKRSFFGQVGQIQAFLSKNRVVIELPMFSRLVPVTFEIKDLQIL